MTCSEDPKAHHGFDRNASHNEGRYVCECESAAQEPLGDSEGAATPVAADLVIRLRIPGDEVFSSRMKSQIADRIEALEKERGMWKETDLRDAKRVDELAEQLGTLNEALTITSQGNANMKKQLAALTKERELCAEVCENLREQFDEIAYPIKVAIKQMEDATPVAYEVRNGLVGFQIWYEKDMADRVAAEQQKRHDLSGSLAAFHVVPLFETQKSQVPTIDPNCTCDEHGACAYCWNGNKYVAPTQESVAELIKRDEQIQRLVAENMALDEQIAKLEAELVGFTNAHDMRQCMIETADENNRLVKHIENLVSAGIDQEKLIANLAAELDKYRNAIGIVSDVCESAMKGIEE